MIPFFKLIRLPNLLIMAFTQYMVRWYLLIPVMELKSHDLDYSLLKVQMTELDFFLLVLSTVMIGAAGYIINDYFD
ncbi:MAG TPA: prenyltransferase, partial [Bacteroidia bacterium]|nr:prenyltransferase [Bacteroidia bacterium]